MDKIQVIHDVGGGTLTVWIGDPQQEASCSETGDEVVLMKDDRGRVIGFELLNYAGPTRGRAIEVETVVLDPGANGRTDA